MEALKARIINNSTRLGLLDRLDILSWIANVPGVKIIEHADGSRINIDLLPGVVLIELDEKITKQLDGIPPVYQIQ